MIIERIIKELRKDSLYMNKEGTEQVSYAIKVLHNIQKSGYVIVPKEPTEEAMDILCNATNGKHDTTLRNIYKAMIEAAQELEE